MKAQNAVFVHEAAENIDRFILLQPAPPFIHATLPQPRRCSDIEMRIPAEAVQERMV